MFGQRLRDLRKKRRMSQEDLEAASGVAQEYISGLERGVRSNPSREVITSLANALEIPPKELGGAVWEDAAAPSIEELRAEGFPSDWLEEWRQLERLLTPEDRAALLRQGRALVRAAQAGTDRREGSPLTQPTAEAEEEPPTDQPGKDARRSA